VEWGSQWLLYELWRLGGYPLLGVTSALLAAVAFGILARILLERGARPGLMIPLWAALVFSASVPDMAVRSQQFAYPLFAGLLWLLLRDSQTTLAARERAAALLALLVLWANVHGSVLVGAGLVAAYGLYRRRPLLTLGAILAPLATPYGLDTIDYYRSVIGNSAIRHFASEWAPSSPTNHAAAGFLVVILALVASLWIGLRHGYRPSWPLAVVTFGLVVAGFAAIRWETWAAFAAAILACDATNTAAKVGELRPPGPKVTVAVFAAAVAGAVLLAVEKPSTFETGATSDYIPGPGLILADSTADALLWKHPELAGRVAMDARLEIYPQAAVNRWAAWIRGGKPLPGRWVLVTLKHR
jgi:hypothetical protein